VVDIETSILIATYKQGDMVRECLESIRTCLGPIGESDAFEVVLVVNGAQFEWTPSLIGALSGVRLVDSSVNLGFSGGYNLAARESRGKYLLLLNDDTIVQPNFLRPLVDILEAKPDVAAAGSCNLSMDGTIAEAGSVIFSDGITMGVGRGQPANTLEWDFVRDVDYCSASSLLIRRDVWEEVGGLDDRFHPAYHEDVDLCLRIRERGYRIVYEPRSKVIHHVSQSTDESFRNFLFRRNGPLPIRRFINKFRENSPTSTPPMKYMTRQAELAAQRARGVRRQVLLVDDLLPAQGLGSGFSRPIQMLADLHDAGEAVTIETRLPVDCTSDLLRDFGVRVVPGDLDEYLRRPEIVIDAAIISRPPNVPRCIDAIRTHQPHAVVIMDHEALYHRRLFRQAEMATDPTQIHRFTVEGTVMEEQERRATVAVDLNVCISNEEADFVRSVPGSAPVLVLEPRAPETEPTEATADGRRDMLFVAGWMAGPESPNVDALMWFAENVMPHVRAAIPWAKIRVTGASPPANVRELESDAIDFVGFVDDLRAAYRGARAVIAPIRYGAGVKIKTVEALEYGVPTVATVVGAEGIQLGNHPEALIVTDDPRAQADALIALLGDTAAWDAQRRAVDGLLGEWRQRRTMSWSAIVDQAELARRERGAPPLSWADTAQLV
jgi:GT2 family glycosyltransferase